jgi:hypothetical protein
LQEPSTVRSSIRPGAGTHSIWVRLLRLDRADLLSLELAIKLVRLHRERGAVASLG